MIPVQFRFCSIAFEPEYSRVITRFPDGTEAHACPHDTPEYHAHALEKTGLDDPMLYCWQHELMHVIHAELRNRPSIVLWALAHNEPTDTPECQLEETEAQDLQRAFQIPNRNLAFPSDNTLKLDVRFTTPTPTAPTTRA